MLTQPKLMRVAVHLMPVTFSVLIRRLDALERRLSGHLALEPDDAATAGMVLERVRLARAALVSARLVATTPNTPE